MIEILIGIAFWYIFLYGIVATLFELLFTNPYKGTLIMHPKDLYERSSMNMFGCIVMFTLLSIVSPLAFIIKMMVLLFTCGRKKS